MPVGRVQNASLECSCQSEDFEMLVGSFLNASGEGSKC